MKSIAGGQEDGENDDTVVSKAPSFNGKTVFPMKVFMNGLKGHKVAAVFAILNNQHKRGQEGWDNVQHISITKDLYKELENLQNQYTSTQVAHVRALSFVYPQKSAMQEVANRWTSIVDSDHGGIVPWEDVSTTCADKEESNVVEMTEKEKIIQLMKETAFYDDDDEDDDEFEDFDDDDLLSSDEVKNTIDATKASTSTSDNNDEIVSPFDKQNDQNNEEVSVPVLLTDDKGQLIFNSDNVCRVLDEIRPYLISDGGNVSVQRVDEETRSVYLKLEGACGSCASSTVTMSMGIQRVLKENFDNLGEVVQVEDDDNDGDKSDTDSDGLTMGAITSELNRIGPAISAMGGNVEVISVDPIGVVELRFRGSNKIQQGLELALRDVPLVKHVKFVN